jgi:hypothetical protein
MKVNVIAIHAECHLASDLPVCINCGNRIICWGRYGKNVTTATRACGEKRIVGHALKERFEKIFLWGLQICFGQRILLSKLPDLVTRENGYVGIPSRKKDNERSVF